MVLVFEEKEKAVKLLVNPRKQVEKAMQVGKIVSCCFIIFFSTQEMAKMLWHKTISTQEMAKHLKKDPASLLFSLEKEGRRLTGKEIFFSPSSVYIVFSGKEMMGDLEGARIVITRLY